MFPSVLDMVVLASDVQNPLQQFLSVLDVSKVHKPRQHLQIPTPASVTSVSPVHLWPADDCCYCPTRRRHSFCFDWLVHHWSRHRYGTHCRMTHRSSRNQLTSETTTEQQKIRQTENNKIHVGGTIQKSSKSNGSHSKCTRWLEKIDQTYFLDQTDYLIGKLPDQTEVQLRTRIRPDSKTYVYISLRSEEKSSDFF